MYRAIVFLFAIIVACGANVAVTPPIKCGPLPNIMLSCLGAPTVVKTEVASRCNSAVSECEKMTCIFRESGWLDGDKLNKEKLLAYFEKFGEDHPEWQAAVESLKTTCLRSDLPAQGVHLNCPAYDATLCVSASFIKNAQPSVWKTSPRCDYPRQYAAACPVCPDDCFAALVPIGSCNACLTLPRSP